MPVNDLTLSAHRRWPLRALFGWTMALCVAVCVWVMEARFSGLDITDTQIGDTPVTLYRTTGTAPLPPVLVAHGFGGSRQMMDQISVSLARQGFLVASIDLIGHGRNGAQLSPDITRIEGTTQQLVAEVSRVAGALVARDDTAGPISFVGHSMSTDVVIRAAEARDDVGGVVAVSMYSPAVTASHPQAMLVVSGATEQHLREAGLDAARQLDPAAIEGETVSRDGTTRRTSVAPYVGHVGVLYSPTSLNEITTWLRTTTGEGRAADVDNTGWVSGVLLLCLALLGWPLSKLLPRRFEEPAAEVPTRTFWICLAAPIPLVLAAALLPKLGIAGYAAFGTLALIFVIWGVTQLLILARGGIRFAPRDAIGTLAYLAFGLGIFAVALDRYGAAFLPTGDRAIVLAGLLIGTIPLMLADTALTDGASLWRRIVARVALIFGLASAIAVAPTELGIAFTVVPVFVLFFVVYGTFGRWISARRGPGGIALGKAVALAWAVAASTPLFATALTLP
ncbi:MAG: alpha/beta fold hydrolase [Pseudomonadota bacterium]